MDYKFLVDNYGESQGFAYPKNAELIMAARYLRDCRNHFKAFPSKTGNNKFLVAANHLKCILEQHPKYKHRAEGFYEGCLKGVKDVLITTEREIPGDPRNDDFFNTTPKRPWIRKEYSPY